jgi:hypothetical protein
LQLIVALLSERCQLLIAPDALQSLLLVVFACAFLLDIRN